MANPDFQSMFADHIYADLCNNGVLTASNAAAMYQEEANTVAQAIVTESARWGNITGTLYTPNDWTNGLNWHLNSYFPYADERHAGGVPQQHHDHAGNNNTENLVMYPSFDPPTLDINGVAEYGGLFNLGDQLTFTTGLPAGTTIYYSLDGTDPRLSGGGSQHGGGRTPICSRNERPDRAHGGHGGAGPDGRGPRVLGRHLERPGHRPLLREPGPPRSALPS